MMQVVKQMFSRRLDALLGRGESAVTVPPMDGALQPNNRLEEFSCLYKGAAVDNLVVRGDKLLFSSGLDVFELCPVSRKARNVAHFRSAVSALAGLPDGGWVAGLTSGEIHRVDARGNHSALSVSGYRGFCPTAIVTHGVDDLLIAEGSAHFRVEQWKHDLMSGHASGSIWSVNLRDNSAVKLVDKLAFPYGLCVQPDGRILVTESWRHRLVSLGGTGGTLEVELDDLPGYPSRISAATDGGYWLSVFAPRSQLIEFVLREHKYKTRMMAEIAEEHWVAPALSSGRDFKEPLQGGAIKSMGILKPWAPTRSYGLVVKLDASLSPVESFHSRADGRRHGVTSVVQMAGRVVASSKGGGEIIDAPYGAAWERKDDTAH